MKKTLATILVGGAVVVGLFAMGGESVPSKQPAQPPVALGGVDDGLPRFAEIDPNTGEVLRVIVIDQANINTGKWGNPANFIETSKTGAIRKNHAGKGYTYDANRDAFIAPKPRADATLDEATARWELPIIEENLIATSTDI